MHPQDFCEMQAEEFPGEYCDDLTRNTYATRLWGNS